MKAYRNLGSGLVLIELVVVMAIILVLFVLYFGSSGSQGFQHKQQTLCRQNLQFVFGALQTFAIDNQERYPIVKGAETSELPLSLLVPRYTARTEIFICPGSKDKSLPAAQSFEKRRISYAYLMGLTNGMPSEQWLMSDEQINSKAKAIRDPLFSSDGSALGNKHHKYGGVLLFCDGHVEFSSASADKEVVVPFGTVILNPRR